MFGKLWTFPLKIAVCVFRPTGSKLCPEAISYSQVLITLAFDVTISLLAHSIDPMHILMGSIASKWASEDSGDRSPQK